MARKMTGLLALLGMWTLLAGQGDTHPVHMNLNDRELLPTPTNEQIQTYIIHMESTPTGTISTLETPHSRYSKLLQSVQQTSTTISAADDESPSGAGASLPIHVYDTVLSGFSARLTPGEASMLRQRTGVLGVFPDRVRSLHTTRSPDFMGLSNLRGLWPQAHYGDDVIIGVLDTGIWPERASFSDTGLGPIPSRWKGICQPGKDFNSSNCNNKLIGARYYSAGYEQAAGPMNETVEWRSARDTEGHGTHTTSTAAGSVVWDASLNGFANGTARGMAPKARIAVYKICWIPGCYESDILAGFDQAVADGVDVISLSVGGPVVPYDVDSIAIGAFGAMKRGIFVSCSAGNDGPDHGTVSNISPWIMTVAASTLDRSFPANVALGDGQVVINGVSLYRGNGSVTMDTTQVIYGRDAALGNVTEAAICLAGSLNATLVKGKIVVCERGVNFRVKKGSVVLAAGGAGMILANTAVDGESTVADAHLLPALNVGFKEATTLATYMNNVTTAVTGKFQFLGTQLGVRPAPATAGFSSRGPNILTPEVLKPDITAPGVDILAAWTGHVGPTGLESFDTRVVNFNIISGTSMSCPHVSGLGALLKSAHPDWSPAAIKSAMMTTASLVDNAGGLVMTDGATGAPGSPWEFGSGHVMPEKALDPGLVYDMGFQDYVNFLCSSNSNYTTQVITIFTGVKVRCPSVPVRLEDMNYPSFSAVFKQPPSLLPVSVNMTRSVRNVGNANATYTAQIVAPLDANVTVDPSVLTFAETNETKSFTIQVTTVNTPSVALVNVSFTEFAFLVWSDGTHSVQSPISITVNK